MFRNYNYSAAMEVGFQKHKRLALAVVEQNKDGETSGKELDVVLPNDGIIINDAIYAYNTHY
jgi:hypothetical protein